MPLRYAALALLFTTAPALAQPFVIERAVSGGGPSADVGDGIALAHDGSRYVVGTFEDTATFGDLSITSAGDSDIFLVKYDGNLDAVWARRAGTDVFNDFGGAVAVGPDGSVYATGFFTGVATWDGGSNPDGELTTFSDFDAFLAKYTPEGDLEWVRQAGGVGQDTGRDLAVDADGNVYLVGGFEGTGTFGGVTLESAGSSDAFLAKYDADGEIVWARRGGSDQGDLAYGVAVTDDGRAHVSGSFRGVAIFGNLPIQSTGETDVFVVQYDADGEAVWVEGIGADGSEFTRGGGIGLGPDESVYVTGSFQNTILVGSDVLESQGFTDIFVAKLTSEGDEVWGVRGGGDGTNFSAALAVDASGNVLTTGYIDGTGTFADEPITTQGRDGYLAVFDDAGDLVTLELLGGTGQDAGTGVAVNADRFAATGSFRGTATFGDLELTSAGASDVYVLGGPAAGDPVPSTIFVDADAMGAETGLSWADAFTDLQDALALAATLEFDSLAIWVAEGTYYPTDDDDRNVSFELVGGTALFGGFDGTETELSQRDWETNEAVLSGDIGVVNDALDNSHHVIRSTGVYQALLDGFIISDGVAYGTGTDPENQARGGGLFATSSEIEVRHCNFRLNQASGGDHAGLGGGAYVEGTTIIITATLFESNEASDQGGGLYGTGSNLSVSQVEFISNAATQSGGGLGLIESSATISMSRFVENEVTDTEGNGGGAYILNGSPSIITDTVFEENWAYAGGGGMYAKYSEISYRRLSFVRNGTAGTGGGLYHEGYYIAEFSDNLFAGNQAVSGGGGMATYLSSPNVIRDTRFSRNGTQIGAAALSLTGEDGRLLNVYFAANRSNGGSVLRLGDTSSHSVTNAIFVGNVSGVGVLSCAEADVDFINATVVSNTSSTGGTGGITGGFQCQVRVRNSILWQNENAQADPDVYIDFSIVEGASNIPTVLDANPLFAQNPDIGPDGIWGTEDDDYGDLRLQEGSPAIDFGRTEFLPPDTFDLDDDGNTEEPLPLDLDGEPRVQGNEVDLGAYESPFAVALEPGAGVPMTSALAPAYPNPFREATTLALDVAEAQEVTIEVFDVLGRRVAVVHDGPLDVGNHRVVIEAGGLPAGVYVVRAEGEAFQFTQRVTLVR